MSRALSQNEPGLPTYKTAAGALERHTGSGWKLAGWTVARTGLIAVPMLIVGVDAKRAIGGSLFASGLISILTLMRIYNGKKTGFGLSERKLRQLTGPKRARGRHRR